MVSGEQNGTTITRDDGRLGADDAPVVASAEAAVAYGAPDELPVIERDEIDELTGAYEAVGVPWTPEPSAAAERPSRFVGTRLVREAFSQAARAGLFGLELGLTATEMTADLVANNPLNRLRPKTREQAHTEILRDERFKLQVFVRTLTDGGRKPLAEMNPEYHLPYVEQAARVNMMEQGDSLDDADAFSKVLTENLKPIAVKTSDLTGEQAVDAKAPPLSKQAAAQIAFMKLEAVVADDQQRAEIARVIGDAFGTDLESEIKLQLDREVALKEASGMDIVAAFDEELLGRH